MNHWNRIGLVVFLLGVLVGLFIWVGTLEPDPTDNNYPDESDIHNNPELYLGEQVSVSGTIVNTEPLTTSHQIYPNNTITFTIENADIDADIGDRLSVYGTLHERNKIQATGTVHAEQGKMQDMYIVSFLAGLWVLGRLLNWWTVDTQACEVAPLNQPRFKLRGE
jgi:hypothetical protein